MKNKCITLIIVAAVGLMAAFLFSQPATAKDKKETPGFLNVFGKVKSAATIPHDVVITVFKDGEIQNQYGIDEDGHFDFKLPLNKTYDIYVTGYMMISKTFRINTTVPDQFRYCEYDYKFNINLVGGYQEPEYPIAELKPPVAKILYNAYYDGFDYDREYYAHPDNQGMLTVQ